MVRRVNLRAKNGSLPVPDCSLRTTSCLQYPSAQRRMHQLCGVVLMRVQERLSPALWCLLALLTLSVIINYIDRGSLSIAAPLLKDELGLTPSQIGILLSSFFWTYAAFMLISGWLADHLDVNWVLAAGFLVWSGATVATGADGEVWLAHCLHRTGDRWPSVAAPVAQVDASKSC